MAAIVDTLVYPLLFLTLFFEVFVVLTLFEYEAKKRRRVRENATYPTVSIIVPCYNEAATLGGTVESLLRLDYPKDKLTVFLVDDGSTDETPAVMAHYAENRQIKVMRKENGGKHTALNAGIAASTSEFVGCLDADSFVTPPALKRVVSNFDDAKIAAVTSSMSVHEPKTILERMQEAEYLFGIMLRHSVATFNGLYVTPGPFTIFRKSAIDAVGPFRTAHQTEDMEMALRLQKAGWKIQNAPNASVVTKVPTSVGGLIKQRTRWVTGFLRNSIDYWELFGNPKMGILGLLVLPLGVFSIFSLIFLFFAFIVKSVSTLIEWSARAMEVPLSFTFSLHSLDWFFMPVSAILILSLVSLFIVFASMWIGARISGKQVDFGFTFLWYFLLYMTIATVWQIRAVADVATGTRRSWR
jgi:cellulose synthase/poly-beta-1,6-N-acetylglucosamine synthase-like glycosyltransferase